MDFTNNHPLDAITRNNPYSMLEALIPFVDQPMKLALALIVKYYEVKMILNAFKSNDIITAYGLHKESKDPMDMIASLTGMSPEMLKTIMAVMQESGNDSLHNVATVCNRSLHNTTTCNTNQFTHPTDTNHSDYNFSLDENINRIFSDYDLLQAAELNEKERFT